MIARLGVVLGLDSAEFTKGIEAAGKKLEQFSQAAEKAGKIGATALVASTAAALQYADELADVAKANEVAIGTILKLSNALGNAGGKADDSGKLLASFTKFIDEAAGGSLQAQKTATMLGVTLQDLGKMSEEQLLNKVIKNLGSMEDSVTRNAKAMEIFGRAAKGVDFVGLAEDMDKANTVTKEQEEAIQKAADVYDMLQQRTRNYLLLLATEAGPKLVTTIDYFKELNKEGNTFGEIFKAVFETVALAAGHVAFVVKTLIEDFKSLGQAGIALVRGDFAEIARIYKDATERAERDRAKLDLFTLDIFSPKSVDAGPAAAGPGRNVTKARDKDAEEAERRRLKMIADLNREAQKYAKLLFDIEGQQVAAYTNEAKRIEKEQGALAIKEQMLTIDILLREMRSEDIYLTKELFLAEQKRLDAIQEINRNNLLDADAKEQLIQRENELADAAKRYAQAQNEAVKAQREGGFYEGFGKAANRFLRDMPTELEQGAKAFETVMGNMESAIDRFVKTGKMGFKDLAKSIIQDMIAMQMKAAASNFLSSLFGSMFGMRANPYQPAAMTGVPGYADGGSPAVGQPSIVGERGPELFVPRTAGSIIPNHALSNMGGTTNVTNNYINAIDTKSFEDRLLASPNAVWAANQYGGKSLAVNRGRA